MKNIRTQKVRYIINTDEFRKAIVENAVSIYCFVMTVRFWRPLVAGFREFNYGEWLPRRSLVQRSATECVSLNVIRCNNNPLQNKNKQHQSITTLLQKEYSFIQLHVLIPT